MTTYFRAFAVTACVLAGACARKAPLPPLPESRIGLTPVSEVESVTFLAGDMGEATWENSPMAHYLAQQVDAWARDLKTDSAVTVLFLGDNVYPAGMHDRDDPLWSADSAALDSQIRILGGASARANNARGFFIAGTHDWGHMFGPKGEKRLKNQEDFISRRRASGINVRFLPPASTPGPGIVDIGKHFRMILIDTAWWLLSADKAEKERTMGRLHAALSQKGQREVLIAAHHPMRSASSHGGLTNFWSAFGVKWLLQKSGAALQDLNSLPYRDLLDRLNATFRAAGPPLVFVGGHDHNLQVMRAVNETEPRFLLVSGAGSKSSKIGQADGMLFRASDPGFMQVVVRKNGGVDLYVYATPVDYLTCATQQCVIDGTAKFSYRFGQTLK
jgi:hypothetical protein